MKIQLWLLTAVLAVMPMLATAKPASPTINVPDQPWYPSGYRDLRIAAEATVTSFPRPRDWMLSADYDDPSKEAYDVIDCSLGYDLPENPDWQLHLRELLALDVARMRTELRKLGYWPEVYEQALLDHERASLAHFPAVREPAPIVDYEALPEDAVIPEPGPETSEDDDSYYDSFWGLEELAAKIEAQRIRLQPNKPRFIKDGGCGAGETEFSVVLSPPNGRLWLINAFAFKVCERKVADPWNHEACSWSEFTSGDTTTASGRYMYEARWPNGTVRRGAKLLQETEDGGAIVIRQN